jgi:hypothetical protein
LLVAAAVAAFASAPPLDAGRELGATIGRRIACAPRLPEPCNRHPLARAYGFPLGKLVRALAPEPMAAVGPGGLPLVPVDFRYCRRASCAMPGSRRRELTRSNRRTTVFTVVEDDRRRDGTIRITYWLYRPTLGWERVVRSATRSDVAATSSLRLRVTDDPVLVPLETLDGRNHYEFPAVERPPWRWKVRPISPGARS